ncbi:hypothetical protein ACIRRH_33540 [Kitasatospora sp. NPDC101235]|uniref:hypothetical protein n=1 Tax=Kitasatospora sp. NPDC101235 TaxID=3364101 RepID=UPI0037FAC590
MKDIAQALRGWTPEDPASEATIEYLTLEPELFEVVSSHQAGDQRFLVAFDWNTIGGPPGMNRALAVHVAFDPGTHRCRVHARGAPTFGWAGRWLVGRGADPRAVADYRPVPDDPYNLGPGDRAEGLISGQDYGFTRPGSRATRLIEDRVRRCGDRYRFLDSANAYPSFFNGEREATFVLLQDRHPRAVGRRFLIQLETVNVQRATYTITEGGFRTLAQARDWIDGIDAYAGTTPLLSATDPVTGLAPLGLPAPVRDRVAPVQGAATVARRTR